MLGQLPQRELLQGRGRAAPCRQQVLPSLWREGVTSGAPA